MTGSSAISLYRPLTRRPAATTVHVRELLHKVEAGEVRIPKFQRPLRWRQQDVVELLDSVWRGYPIGSLLFWKRRAEAERVQVGGAYIEAPAVSDAWWVVDGQQRTTALAASLLELDHAGDSRWLARFDPETETFLPGLPSPARNGIDVPVSVLGDLRRLGRWLRESQLDAEQESRVEAAQQRLLDYAIPAYVVDTEDEQALRGVFARLNSTGARMRADEVFQALLGVPSSAEHNSLDLNVLQAECERDGFGTPPRAEILKAVLAMSGLDPSRRLEDLSTIESLNLVGREDASAALSRTIEFLRVDCGIPLFSLIPYPVAFVMLAKWFHLHPAPLEPHRNLLARWLWRGAASGAHQRAEVSRMREQVRAIREGEERESLDRLLARAGSQPVGGWTLSRFNLKSARSRIEILAMLSLQPRDELGPININELGTGRIAREIFRASEWDQHSEPVKDLARSAANRVLLGSAHTGLSRELRSWTWDGSMEALSSHLIDAVGYERLRANEMEAFLRHRAEKVRRLVGVFLERRAGWSEPELKPLELYLNLPDDED